MTKEPSAIGAVIRTYRRQHGLFQEQLAAKIGVTQTVISYLERGRHRPSVRTLARMTAVFGEDFHRELMDAAQQEEA